METEEGPGYADFSPPPGSRSDPRDIPRSRYRAAATGVAAASADSSYYEAAEAAEPRHSGLGAGGDGGGGGGAAAAVGSWPSHGLGDGFVSGGRHVLYCGADIPMEQLKMGHWHHSQRPRGLSPLQAAASSPRATQHHLGEGLFSRAAEAGGGGGGGAAREGDRPMGQQGASWMATYPGAQERQLGLAQPPEPAGGETIEDDVVEVEADTPAGYHVAATVLHPADSKDPEEYVVAATAVMPPTHGSGGGAPAY
ncbi:hypothetical protein PLESTB_001381300 [Pleodorina starrii]|uniref:Uncharacterized protein n=1 Tax=Pleodorina starrii TaxID=330485 RepID=A0A9W6BUS5_9CHLO|nr:hypothetical protein PLESTM_000403900 [Pleodorina starrii]GLC58622.1 hypothetical protein PLESTB_001381300 [Pleodorina starrii]GLC67471.1 hypothetical protein PLESTF_000561100 [Pleodorina starrii]